MGKTKIEWTASVKKDGSLSEGYTANLWWGCVSVHIGCQNCFAEALSKRFGDDVWGNDKPRREIKSVWKDLDKYQRLAKAAGEKHKVFVGSMMDIFEKPMPLIDNKGERITPKTINALSGEVTKEWVGTDFLRHRLFEGISAGFYPNLMFLFLTKRPSNINKYIPEIWKTSPPANVMFGTSPVNQETADKLIPQLLEVKGKKFLSIEPQLGHVDLTSIKGNAGCVYQVLKPITGCGDANRDAVSWVIQGGESGHNRRPFNLNWAYSMKKQCADAGVPYFFKQIDKIKEIPTDLFVREFPIL